MNDKDNDLRIKLKYDIIMWYKHWYMGDADVLYKHLQLFDQYYDPRLFDDEKKLKENIVEFMTFLQDKLNNERIE